MAMCSLLGPLLCVAGSRFSEGGIPLAIAANLIWRDGRRGFMECAFDRAPVQYLEVSSPALFGICGCATFALGSYPPSRIAEKHMTVP